MQITRTKGFSNGEGKRKGYDIQTECGKVFRAMPLGSQRYQCNGLAYKSLRAVKDSIIKGALSETASDEVSAENTSITDGADTWDCVHPCALLARLYDLGLLGALGHKHKGILKEYRNTLDNYGWNDEQGRPDVAKADREIRRVYNLKKETADVHN